MPQKSKATDEFRDAVREYMEEHGLGPSYVAEHAGVSRQMITRVLSGEADCTIAFAEKLAHGLGIDLWELIERKIILRKPAIK